MAIMALSVSDTTKVWEGFLKLAATCPWLKEEIIQVVTAVDTWATDNVASYNAALPAFFRTGARAATADEKSAMLAAVVIMRMTTEVRKTLLANLQR